VAKAQAQAVTVSQSHGVEAARGIRTSRAKRSWREKTASEAEVMALVTQMVARQQMGYLSYHKSRQCARKTKFRNGQTRKRLAGGLAVPVAGLAPQDILVVARGVPVAEPSVAERAAVASIPLVEPVTVTVAVAVAVAAAAAASSIPAAVLPTRPVTVV
jgi:hypothetical protein